MKHYITKHIYTTMKKTALKTVTLFDIIVDNKHILIAVLYEIVVLLYLYYTKRNIHQLTNEFPQYEDLLKQISNNLSISQNLSLITLFIQAVIRNNFTTKERHIGILVLTIFVKSILNFKQMKSIGIEHINSIGNIAKLFNSSTFVFLISIYHVQFVIAISCITLLILCVCIFIVLLIENIWSDIKIKLVNWLKNYKIHYIEYNEVSNLEDVLYSTM